MEAAGIFRGNKFSHSKTMALTYVIFFFFFSKRISGFFTSCYLNVQVVTLSSVILYYQKG